MQIKLDGIFPLSCRVKSCKVSPDFWWSTLGQTSDPISVEEINVIKIKVENYDYNLN